MWDGFEAVDQIQAGQPDLVFLDLQMPGMDGFEVLRRIPHALLPVVIFSTAYDQHALRAFEVNALDYLLKPSKPERFAEAVQRARTQIANKQAGLTLAQARGLFALLGETPTPAGQLTRLAVKTLGKVTFVELDQIQAIEAAGKYAVVHVGKREPCAAPGHEFVGSQSSPATIPAHQPLGHRQHGPNLRASTHV